jgi:hypothetical protein
VPSGGGGGGTPTPTPTLPPSITHNVSTGGAPVTVTFSQIAALVSGTVTLPATSASTSATVTLGPSVPLGDPTPDARQIHLRAPAMLGGTVSVLACVTVSVSNAVSITATPAFSLNFPSGTLSGFDYVAYYDPGNAASGYNVILGPQQPSSSSSITFNSATLPQAVSLQANTNYVFCIVQSASTLPTPTPAPSIASLTVNLNPSTWNYGSSGSTTITVTAKSSTGATITGTYPTTVTIANADGSGNSNLSGTTITSSSGSVELSFNGSYPGGTITASTNAGATTATNELTPVLTDDWTSYAHDQQLTGYEQQFTGITSSTIANLPAIPAWETSPDNGACETTAMAHGPVFADEAAPLVYGGFVYYANVCGAVYALHRADGSIAWGPVQLPLPTGFPVSGVLGTPAIDPSSNALFVPVWGAGGTSCPGVSCSPSYGGYVAALNAQTGSVVWKSAPLSYGQIRGEPFVYNGDVYIGVAGGDPDAGYVQGGMMELNESTGAKVGFWQVSPTVANTGDGGSQWSPISTDTLGNIYFGTGNTLNNDGLFDGVVQMNASTLAPNASFAQTYCSSGTCNTADGDVGGGPMIYGGSVYFVSKNGYFYGYPVWSPGSPLFTPVLINANARPGGNGGIGTPTTDGTAIGVTDGYDSSSPLTGGLHVFQIGSWGSSCQIPTGGSAIFGAPAWVKGVMFIGMDNDLSSGTKPEFKAFDDNCHQIWAANDLYVKGFFYAGPAVVQSGVYAIDNVGNVYAWKMPATVGVQTRRVTAARHINPPVRAYITRPHRFFPDSHGIAHARD